MLKQLLAPSASIPSEILIKFKEDRVQRKSLELSDAITFFRSTCQAFDVAYICIDALDECNNIDELLRSLKDLPPSVRIFTTCRNHIKNFVCNHFKSAPEIEIKASEADIRAFVESKIRENCIRYPEIMDEKLKKDIQDKIAQNSKGM